MTFGLDERCADQVVDRACRPPAMREHAHADEHLRTGRVSPPHNPEVLTMNTDFSSIELLVSQLEDIDRASPMMASLSWSFAMSIGQLVARIHRVFDPDDAQYAKLSYDAKADLVRTLEARLEAQGDLMAWAARQATPGYTPTGEDVASRLAEGSQATEALSSQSVAELAEELGVSITEIVEAQAINDAKMKQNADLQALCARNRRAEIVTTVDRFLGSYELIEAVNIHDAIRIVEKIAGKCSVYAQNLLAMAIHQTRQNRRTEFNAQRRLLLDIEAQADTLLLRFKHARDASASDQEPVLECARSSSEAAFSETLMA